MRVLILIFFVFNSLAFSLSKDILADKYLIAAKKFVKEKKYVKAVENFEKIFSLGVSVPNDMYYFYAKSLHKNGNIIKAYDTFNLYIEKSGRGSNHYQDALGYIVDLENAVIKKKSDLKKEDLRKKKAIKKKRIAAERIKQEKLREQIAAKRIMQENLRKKIVEDKKEAIRLNNLGYKLLTKGEYLQSYSYFVKANKLDKESPMPYCNIGYLYGTQEYFSEHKSEAIDYYKKCASLGRSTGYNNIGHAYEFGDLPNVDIDYAKAIKNYKKAIEIDANNKRAYYHLGVMMAEGKGFDINLQEAKKNFQKASDLGDKQADKYLEKLENKFKNINEIRKLNAFAVKHGYKSYPIETYIDPNTKLMWQSVKTKDDFELTRIKKTKYSRDKLFSYDGAKQYCKKLYLGGNKDWRIPTLKELLTIVRFKAYNYNDIDKIRNELLTKKLSNDKELLKFLEYNTPSYRSKLTRYNRHDRIISALRYASIEPNAYGYSIYEDMRYWSSDDYVMKKNNNWVLNASKYATEYMDLEGHANAICVRSNK